MTTTRLGLVLASIIALAMLALGAMSALAAPSGAGDPAKGKYIMAANGGCGCHGPDHAGFKPGAPPDQSGVDFQGPFGNVTAKNITPDRETGEGKWTDAQKINAIRNGVDDEGKQLFPIMPYLSFHFMSDGDVADLVAYLDSLPAVVNKVPENKLNGPVPPPPPLPPSPATAPSGGVERGRYLATVIGICGDCHTPMLPDGSPDNTKFLGGGSVQDTPTSPPEFAANVTPDMVTGIGGWTNAQIFAVLRYGLEPEGTAVSGLMHDQVFGITPGVGGYNQLTDDDTRAIVAFLRTIPPVSNVPTTGAGFTGGFKALADQIPDVVGLPLENEHKVASGDVIQMTPAGLFVWHPATNSTSFTDGSSTWTVTPSGVQQTPNT